LGLLWKDTPMKKDEGKNEQEKEVYRAKKV